MIELPEAITFARQFNTELRGKQIVEANCGNSSHKFAFYSKPPEEYTVLLPEKTLGTAYADGSLIRVPVKPGYELIFGEGGERILYHLAGKKLPKKYQFYASFEDGSSLTVSISGWGAALLLTPKEAEAHHLVGPRRISPLDDDFTMKYFLNLFSEVSPNDGRSVKYFLITKPKIAGVGNGCLQDILWQAKIHPRRRVLDISPDEQATLYHALRDTLQQMTDGGGRNTEYDLYNKRGGYPKVMHSKAVSQPCPDCGTAIEKNQYLGGAIYYCPECQK